MKLFRDAELKAKCKIKFHRLGVARFSIAGQNARKEIA
eukprot:CAMPEP_0204839152 /NCGR_PEP_ID=MMETSP1346-20131115/33365_1 /ASSEMBLY_ACC=CAM_ASM_000771 /TAXON_ID=215587 /ORGANISM="Aplanochytrium stocchinoi, Strain GSBS06" /LENGTH=37 /DNA_ID= /DNA_START= /DNA_END= /DNA_ORIENTATION=